MFVQGESLVMLWLQSIKYMEGPALLAPKRHYNNWHIHVHKIPSYFCNFGDYIGFWVLNYNKHIFEYIIYGSKITLRQKSSQNIFITFVVKPNIKVDC